MKRALLTAILLGGIRRGRSAGDAGGLQAAPLTLRKCLEIGLEQNYDVRIVRNEERISDNDATAGNAGICPKSASRPDTQESTTTTTTPRDGGAVSESGVYDQTSGLAVNWTLFDGFRIRTNYKRLKEMQQMGALKTRITIEDFMASLTAEYYNYIQQTLRLQNFRYAVGLSRERLPHHRGARAGGQLLAPRPAASPRGLQRRQFEIHVPARTGHRLAHPHQRTAGQREPRRKTLHLRHADPRQQHPRMGHPAGKDPFRRTPRC